MHNKFIFNSPPVRRPSEPTVICFVFLLLLRCGWFHWSSTGGFSGSKLNTCVNGCNLNFAHIFVFGLVILCISRVIKSHQLDFLQTVQFFACDWDEGIRVVWLADKDNAIFVEEIIVRPLAIVVKGLDISLIRYCINRNTSNEPY